MPPEEQSKEYTVAEQALVELAMESWRFSRVFSRALSKLDAGDGSRFASQLRYFLKRIDETMETCGLRLVSLEGHPYDPGIAASALNIGDFGPEDTLLIEQMVEPIIMGPNGLVKPGAVMLKKIA